MKFKSLSDETGDSEVGSEIISSCRSEKFEVSSSSEREVGSSTSSALTSFVANSGRRSTVVECELDSSEEFSELKPLDSSLSFE